MIERKILVIAVWGTDARYVQGALENVEWNFKCYPDFEQVYYVADNCPTSLTGDLRSYGCTVIEHAYSEQMKRYTRMNAASLPADTFIIRDADSRASMRDADAVKEWLESGKSVHVMRDHIRHTAPIMGGMWGAKTEYMREIQFMNRLQAWINNVDKMGISGQRHSRFAYSDQPFLSCDIWPVVREQCFIHDDWGRFTNECHPFRVKFPEGFFVGQVFDARNKPVWRY